MGSIHKFDLATYKTAKNLTNYVETGTGEGMCLSHAKTFDFSRYVSIEIHEDIHQKAVQKFPNDEILLGNSYEKLKQILPSLSGNTLFFLDAHFPGADFHYAAYTDCKDYDTRLPLEKELSLLVEYRKGYNDVIIIDDLRIYMNGPFYGGNWPLRDTAGSKRCGFIFDLLNELNKSIIVDYRDQGYVIGL